jgi:6-phospho-beta-glucosidase
MAALRIAYVGGGSTRAPGTVAAFVAYAGALAGSEIVLVDLDADRLEVVRTLGERMAAQRGADLRFSATTDAAAGLRDCDAVLTSFRPGGLEARAVDERIPLEHGVVGQETQGPGGFFMALRAIHAMRPLLEQIAAVAPRARVFNYTNPVNIVSQAVCDHTDIPFVSLCEGPLVYPRLIAEAAGLDPAKVDVTSVGLNHASWSVRHAYDGDDLIGHLAAGLKTSPAGDGRWARLARLAVAMGAVPSAYFDYYYFEDRVLDELRDVPRTRAEDILAAAPGYWEHYRQQAASADPRLDPARSRDGIGELELGVECIDAVFNDRGSTLPVNVPSRGTVPGFADDLVVETVGRCHAGGVEPLPQPGLPPHLAGLVDALAAYQRATADAAWSGTARDAVRALASHPLVRSLDRAERLYAAMATAHREHLPARLLP